MLNIAVLFHLNTQYSSIPIDELPTLIEDCYEPLINLISAYSSSCPIALEMSGHSLEVMLNIRPSLFNRLVAKSENSLKIVNGGYEQIPVPLAPYDINKANLLCGNEVYQDSIGVIPKVLYLPEQCWASSVPPIAYNMGYNAVIMEYQNTTLNDAEHREWRYSPVSVDNMLHIWSDSVLWQQFQRYVWGNTTLNKYIELLMSHNCQDNMRLLIIYASDVEAFRKEEHWERIEELVSVLSTLDHIECTNLNDISSTTAILQTSGLSNCSVPLPTKKQVKYSPLRWSVGGYASSVNATCHEITDSLRPLDALPKDMLKLLLQAWGSDYKTHTTSCRRKKWLEIISILREFARAYVR